MWKLLIILFADLDGQGEIIRTTEWARYDDFGKCMYAAYVMKQRAANPNIGTTCILVTEGK